KKLIIMIFKRFLPMLFVALLAPFFMNAQVTTSSISGSVLQASSEGLGGATITATHTPSGSVYQAIASDNGSFAMQGLRSGGPYTITISFVGFKSRTLENVFLTLGESFAINEVLHTTESE